jgi:hypothetical protein
MLRDEAKKTVTFSAASHSAKALATGDSSPILFAVSSSYSSAFWLESFACSSAIQRARLSKTGDMKELLVVETPTRLDFEISDDGLMKKGRLVHLANIPHYSSIIGKLETQHGGVENYWKNFGDLNRLISSGD